jgi:hypothetical protein
MNTSYSKIRHIQESNQRLENRLFKKVITESYREVEDLENWFDSNSDYISSYSLEEKVKELFSLRGDVTSDVSVEKDSGGDEYGENWNKSLITIKHNGDDLVKVWVSSEGRYDYGKNISDFNKGFYFNEYSL